MANHPLSSRRPSSSIVVFSFLILSISQAFGQGTQYFQQRVTYDIRVSLDVQRHLLTGHERLTYYNRSRDTLSFVWIHLYPNAYKDEQSVFAREEDERGINDFFYAHEADRGSMTIDTLRSAGSAVQWQYKDSDETEMKVFLPSGLAPGDSAEISFDFTVKIPRFLSRLGHEKQHYEITQWYPKIAAYDASGWHNDGYHVLGEFYGDYGTFNVTITLPENMWVAASGVLTDKEESIRRAAMLEFTKKLDVLSADSLQAALDSLKSEHRLTETAGASSTPALKTISFHADNVHDFAWVCDARYLIRTTHHANTAIFVYVLPEHYTAWKSADRYARDAVAYMSRWYGEYCYASLCVVDSYNPYGGMEYPNLVLCAMKDFIGFKFLEEVIFHEIGHQWFYGMLGNNEINDPWLDEGLTEFSELRYFKEKYDGVFNDSWIMKTLLGEESINHTTMLKSQLQTISVYNAVLPPASAKGYEYHSRVEFNNVYLRPAFALSMLQYTLGDSVFNEAMRSYYRSNVLHHVTAASLISAFNTTTQRDWQWYFNEWVYSNKQCEYEAGALHSTLESTGRYRTTFDIVRADSIIMPVTVEFMTANDSLIRHEVMADQEITRIELTTTDKITAAAIDPDKNLLEFNQRNNATSWTPVRFNFIIPTENYSHTTLYTLPWMKHDAFKGYAYGGAFLLYDRYPDLYGNESHVFSGSAMYFPHTKSYDYSIGYRGTTKLFTDYNDYSIGYHDFHGKKNADVTVEYRLGNAKFDSPFHNFLLRASFADMYDVRYQDSYIPTVGKDMTLALRYTVAFDCGLSTHQCDVEYRQSIKAWGGEYTYSKMTISTYQDMPVSRRFSFTQYVNAGAIAGSYPVQAGLFLSPSTRTVFSDFGAFSGHRLYYDQYFSGGMAGFVHDNLSGRYLLSARSECNVNILNHPKSPIEPLFLNVFIEGAKLWKSMNTIQSDGSVFLDAGIGMKIAGFTIAFPLWKNYQLEKNDTGYALNPVRRIGLNGVLLNIDLTYIYKVGLEMK